LGGEGIVTSSATVGSGVFATGGTVATVGGDAALTLGTETLASTGLVATEGVVATTAAETTLAVGGSEVLATGGATVLGTVASSVILPVAVGVACYYTGKGAKECVDTANETRHTYQQVDSAFMPGKRAAKFQKPTPDIGNYKNIVPALAEVSKYMKNENMGTQVKRLPDGRIENINDVDWTDPKNRAELNRALDRKIAEDDAIIKANSSWVPRWIRSGDSAQKEEYAKIDEHPLQCAKADLANFGMESDAYIAAKKTFDQQNAPAAATQPATAPRTPAAPRI
jgi:hypothetical protein